MTAGKAAAEVRARIEDWAAAHAKDVDGIMASHSTEVRVFDCHSLLEQRRGCLSPASGSMHAPHAGRDALRAS